MFADLKYLSIFTNDHKISISIEPILNLTPVSIVLKCMHYRDLSLMLLALTFQIQRVLLEFYNLMSSVDSCVSLQSYR